jgi:hypothetical protein
VDVITKQELAFYRKHPELVHAVGNKATIYRVVLITVFFAGFLPTAVSLFTPIIIALSPSPFPPEAPRDRPPFPLSVPLRGDRRLG